MVFKQALIIFAIATFACGLANALAPSNLKGRFNYIPKFHSSNSRYRFDLYAANAIMEGTSPKSIQLRNQIQAIRNDPSSNLPIILYGPRGSGKGELAEEIVKGLPSWQTQNVYRLSLDDGLHFIDTILGTNSHPGLLDDLAVQSNTTLILKGFQSKHVESKEKYDRREELLRALAGLVHGRNYFSTYENRTKSFLPRVVGCTQRTPEYFGEKPDAIFIKVPSFESRRKDLKDIAKAKLKVFEQKFELNDVVLSKEAVQRLLDHTWGIDADKELDSELCNGLKLLASEQKWNPFASNALKSRHLLVNAYNEKIRIRLLYEVPFLREVLMSPWVFGKTLRYIVTPVFVLYLAVLFLGPQARDDNAALTVFWAGWWPGNMLVFPFLGRIWCAVCPFMAVGDLTQEIATSLGVRFRKWPDWGRTAGPVFAFGLFYAILLWEELWDLPENANLSAWLLLLITSGAVVNSLAFEKRLWCRYMCPIGAMNKMFATASMTEVRTWKANCDGCTNPTCVKGESPNLDPSDTFALKGCTMGLKNNQLRDMGDCVMCMSCVKNCEREAPELNLRPIGQDYGLPWLLPMQIQRPESLALSQVETNFWLGGIITILQGSVALHYLPKILADLGIDATIATAPFALDMPFALHAALAILILAFPGTLSYAADAMSIPLESLVNVWKRELTPHPAENSLVVKLYESMLKEGQSMMQWDIDGDGNVSVWEIKEGLKRAGIPAFQHELIQNVLMPFSDKQSDIPISALIDRIQQLYFDIKEAERKPTYQSITAENELNTKLTFVEIFNDLDKDDDGFITKDELYAMSAQGYLKNPLTEHEANDLFDEADILGLGRLNLFEFMSIMRKTVSVGIQEIGYGYLPLAWGSLTAYWLGLGMQE
ncbi:hypothetical protein HJC23_010894 [Cyclotella cryptica]|uniref:Calmodulin n=1 Tax=Cyclotella cryptica TaxID=29204 RepID=A0ABD3Q9I9_9STRA